MKKRPLVVLICIWEWLFSVMVTAWADTPTPVKNVHHDIKLTARIINHICKVWGQTHQWKDQCYDIKKVFYVNNALKACEKHTFIILILCWPLSIVWDIYSDTSESSSTHLLVTGCHYIDRCHYFSALI